jgi:TonB family protein
MRLIPILLLTVASLVPTGTPRAAEPLEHAAVVQLEGTVTVATDGTVADLVLATPIHDALRPAIETRLRQMRFLPVRVGGEPARARTGFLLDVAMFDRPEGGVRLAFDGISFRPPTGADVVLADGELPPMVASDMSPPRYPSELLRMRRSGAVSVAVRVGADGKVEDAAIVRSAILGDGLRDAAARPTLRLFETAVLAQARKWRFTVPPALATQPPASRTCVTSVTFEVDDVTIRPGKWVRVARTAKHAVSWLPGEGTEMASPGNGLAMGTSAFRLAAPLDPTPAM